MQQNNSSYTEVIVAIHDSPEPNFISCEECSEQSNEINFNNSNQKFNNLASISRIENEELNKSSSIT